jgi:hypothetical protein
VSWLFLERKLVLVLGLLLLLPILSPLQVAAPTPPQTEEHEPIFIDGNNELMTTADAEGWGGTGSERSPIVIKGLSISSQTHGIYISNTDLHFRIEECVITEAKAATNWCFGILLENCSAASIERCTVWNHEFAICLLKSDGALVNRTEVFDSSFGVYVNRSSNVRLLSLDIVMCKAGITLNHTIYAYVAQTIIDHCEWYGIIAAGDSGTLLQHNSIIGSDVGAEFLGNGNWVLEESAISLCMIGVDALESDGGFVIRTWIKNCSILGIALETGSRNISIIENWFGPNNTQNAQDDGEENLWYGEYWQMGNYWSDYSGIGSYLIPGSAESVDLYPKSLEDAPDWEDVVTTHDGSITNGTTTGDDSFPEPALLITAASIVIILLAAVTMLRSRMSPGLG